MAVKVIIPTPLRAYAGKQESVEVQAATVGEALAALTNRYCGAEEAPVRRRRPPAQFRERLRERRRHPLPAKGPDARCAKATPSASCRRLRAARAVDSARISTMVDATEIINRFRWPPTKAAADAFATKRFCATAAT